MLKKAKPIKLALLVVSMILGSFMQILSAASASEMRALYDVRIPVRDGTELSADIWMPSADGKYPAILVTTPYVKAISPPGLDLRSFIAGFAVHGYVALYQDARGRGDSEGEFLSGSSGQDGYDTIEWIAKQPWSNGRVCTMGWSALATVQWAAARLEPPHLNCMVATASGAFQQVMKAGGGIGLDAVQWAFLTSGRMAQPPFDLSMDWEKVSWHRPLQTIDKATGRDMPTLKKFIDSSTPGYAPFLNKELDADDYRRINLPALHVTGWFDITLRGALLYWEGMKQYSPAKDQQYLLIGPWDHPQTMMGGSTRYGEMEFTEDSIVDLPDLHRKFFDHYLKKNTGRFDFPYARVYVTGANKWRDFDVYPPYQAKEKRLFLHSAGKANSLNGDGHLNWTAPADEPADTFVYDPRNPVPSPFGDMFQPTKPMDQRPLEAREDILVYTSDILTEPLEIIGDVLMELFAATDGRDTDFTVKLLDVHSDGRAILLGSPKSGIIRARYRSGIENEVLLTPGKVEKYSISLLHMGHVFLPGHRVRIEVSSSAYPVILPNQNTGNPTETDTEWRTAHQTVYHNKIYPSALVLPVFHDAPPKISAK